MDDLDNIVGNVILETVALSLTALGAVYEGIKAVGGVAESVVKGVGDIASAAINTTAKETWEAKVTTNDGSVYKFKLDSKEDLDRLLSALNCPVEVSNKN